MILLMLTHSLIISGSPTVYLKLLSTFQVRNCVVCCSKFTCKPLNICRRKDLELAKLHCDQFWSSINRYSWSDNALQIENPVNLF